MGLAARLLAAWLLALAAPWAFAQGAPAGEGWQVCPTESGQCHLAPREGVSWHVGAYWRSMCAESLSWQSSVNEPGAAASWGSSGLCWAEVEGQFVEQADPGQVVYYRPLYVSDDDPTVDPVPGDLLQLWGIGVACLAVLWASREFILRLILS